MTLPEVNVVIFAFLLNEEARAERLAPLSDRGVQHLSIRYTGRLAEAGTELWVGSNHCLLEPLDYVPPVEYEEAFYRSQTAQDLVVALTD